MGVCCGKCTSNARLDGKTIIITGCNTGIGKCTVADLYQRGGRVIMACRDVTKAEMAKNDIVESSKCALNVGVIIVKKLDLSSIKSIKKFAEEFLKTEKGLHILVNNAGVAFCPKTLTEDGFEMHFGTNHVGHFYLTMLLLPRLIESGPARIVNVASIAHYLGNVDFNDINLEKSYDPMTAYCRTKLQNILFTRELAKKLKGKNVNVYSLHPGFIRTDLDRNAECLTFPGFYCIYHYLISLIMKTPEEGAQTTIYCAVDESIKDESGMYYSDCQAITPHPKAIDEEAAKKLWDITWKLLGLGDYDPFNKNSKNS